MDDSGRVCPPAPGSRKGQTASASEGGRASKAYFTGTDEDNAEAIDKPTWRRGAEGQWGSAPHGTGGIPDSRRAASRSSCPRSCRGSSQGRFEQRPRQGATHGLPPEVDGIRRHHLRPTGGRRQWSSALHGWRSAKIRIVGCHREGTAA